MNVTPLRPVNRPDRQIPDREASPPSLEEYLRLGVEFRRLKTKSSEGVRFDQAKTALAVLDSLPGQGAQSARSQDVCCLPTQRHGAKVTHSASHNNIISPLPHVRNKHWNLIPIMLLVPVQNDNAIPSSFSHYGSESGLEGCSFAPVCRMPENYCSCVPSDLRAAVPRAIVHYISGVDVFQTPLHHFLDVTCLIVNWDERADFHFASPAIAFASSLRAWLSGNSHGRPSHGSNFESQQFILAQSPTKIYFGRVRSNRL